MMVREDFLYVAGSDGHVVIYGKKDRTYYHTLRLHTKAILDFDIHSSGRLLVSFGAEGKLKLTDLASMTDVYHKNIKLGSL
jgi:WD40 repeat protein